jgi:hypothetical protein
MEKFRARAYDPWLRQYVRGLSANEHGPPKATFSVNVTLNGRLCGFIPLIILHNILSKSVEEVRGETM